METADPLSIFDGIWLDGFIFCSEAYRLLDSIKADEGGLSRLRLRGSRITFDPEKRLVEEILPICRFIRERYRPGRGMQVCWCRGNQRPESFQYDAKIRMKKKGFLEEDVSDYFVEVSTVNYSNDHLFRELLEKQGFSGGIEGVHRSKGGSIESAPVIHEGSEFAEKFADLVLNSIREKSEKKYGRNTILILSCNLAKLYEEQDWSVLKRCVEESVPLNAFVEIFIYDNLIERGFTLWKKHSSSTSTAL